MTNNGSQAQHKSTLIVIEGPTGSGKTDVSIRLARVFNAPIISTDSRQFYREIPIGTAQPTPEQLSTATHYFIANRSITDDYTCGKYETEALELLSKLFIDNPIVIAVGGSGLYIDALCKGLDNIPSADQSIREQLRQELETKGLRELADELKSADPEYCKTADLSNPQRVVRALEVYRHTGIPYSKFRSGNSVPRAFDIIKIGITLPREELYERIDKRVDLMIEANLEYEARKVYPLKGYNALQTVGYRELFDYFDNKISKDEAIELIKRNSRRYAKRQMTWFRRDDQTEWFSPYEAEKIEKRIKNLLNQGI